MAIDWNAILQQAARNPMFSQASGVVPQSGISASGAIGQRMAGAQQLLGPLMPPVQGPQMPAASPGAMPRPGYVPQTAPAAPATAAQGGLRGAVGRALPLKGMGGVGLAGTVAGAVLPSVWNDPNSNADEMTSSALSYGGMGAGAGALAGSVVPGVGNVVGGAIGGAAGLAYGLYKGSQAPTAADTTKQLNAAKNAEMARLQRILKQVDTRPKNARTGLLTDAVNQLQVSWELNSATSPDLVKQVADQFIAGVVQQVPAELQAYEQQQQSQRDARYQRTQAKQQERQQAANQAAVQAWMGPMLQDQLNKSQFYADQFRDAGLSGAQQISDPSLRATVEQSARQGSMDQATQNAYAMQLQTVMPAYMKFQQDQLQQQQQQQEMEYQTRLQGLQYRDLSLREQMLNQQQQQLSQGGSGAGSGQDIWQQIMAQQAMA